MKRQQITRRQHTNPQFHLRYFSDKVGSNHFIWCYCKQQGIIKRENIKYVAPDFFYDDNKFPQPIETHLSRIENDMSMTYNKIIKKKSINNLNEIERSHLVDLIYYQYIRTEYMRNKTIQLFTSINPKSDITTKIAIKIQKIIIVANKPHLEYWNTIIKKVGLRKATNKLIKWKIQCRKIIYNLDYILLEIKHSNLKFYSSDNPILFRNKYSSLKDKNEEVFTHMSDPYTQIYYPITPKLCIMFYNSNSYQNYKKYLNMKMDLPESDITLINKLIVHTSYKSIYSKSKDFKFVHNYLEQNPYLKNINRKIFY